METDRRKFLKMAGLLSVAGGLWTNITGKDAYARTLSLAGKLTAHELPPLPYAYNALEPYIDEQTMRIHHDKHHQGYVNGLINAEENLARARAESDFAAIQHWSRSAAFTGGGHFLHSMFWKVMAPAGKGGGAAPKGSLLKKIERDFGSFQAFKAQFTAAAAAVEGSGWGLLHYRPADKRLIVLQAENQHKLSAWGSTPILGIDVWEHAYYLKYQNNRKDYIEAWWNIVNWDQVAANLSALEA